MIRRPPKATLFPSTPLFRSDRGGEPGAVRRADELGDDRAGHLALQPQPQRLDGGDGLGHRDAVGLERPREADRKSTRLNFSHANISYAVFCLKKKNKLARNV